MKTILIVAFILTAITAIGYSPNKEFDKELQKVKIKRFVKPKCNSFIVKFNVIDNINNNIMGKTSEDLINKAAAIMTEDSSVFYVFEEEEFKEFLEVYKEEIKKESD